ncbi:MAG: haloacid dehalogenase-like hydrolase [Candidatus Dadabacteria bacterium]|nr:MAG: haloacid dehalogenase-like hydrolase [Candidatus Dadabacteria bacterium]
MIVGIDFDNTLVCYDRLIHCVALERGLIPAGLDASKASIRDYLRKQGREDDWTELQGYIYGDRIKEAPPFPGALDFFCKCKEINVKTYIISHKTKFPYKGRQYDLHSAAFSWLKSAGFLERDLTGLDEKDVFFELTLEDKLYRIKSAGCDVFIDDLVEFLSHPHFPKGTRRVLFDPYDKSPECGMDRFLRWDQAAPLLGL